MTSRMFKRSVIERARHSGGRIVRLCVYAVTLAILSSCAGGNPSPMVAEQRIGEATTTSAVKPADYQLGSGDKLKLTVYGEEDLSGEFVVDGNGAVSLPLVGQLQVGGHTIPEFEAKLGESLKKFVRNPQVNAQVLNYRPFYIQGEIKSGGEYPYSNGLVVRDAVAKAGGYTYRAVTGYVYIRHANESEERQYSLDTAVPVLPGDNIRVPERIF